MLLLKLVWELEGVHIWRQVWHLLLQWVEATDWDHALVWRNHAHVDILLVGSLNLLLLLLKQFDLLLDSKLLHYQELSVKHVKSYWDYEYHKVIARNK